LKVLSISRTAVDRRWLIPAYRLNIFPMAWECTVYGKLFSVPLTEAEQATDPSPPTHIEREFRLHNCELQFRRHFHDQDL
jgi:hypothetical protein